MYGDRIKAKDRTMNPAQRALKSKMDIKKNIKAAHKRIKREGVDFNKI